MSRRTFVLSLGPQAGDAKEPVMSYLEVRTSGALLGLQSTVDSEGQTVNQRREESPGRVLELGCQLQDTEEGTESHAL